jgi:altronate dehydratase
METPTGSAAPGASTGRRAYHLHPSDNVAVALADLETGEALDLPPGRVVVGARIPFGHKVAVAAVAVGEEVLKYGEVIGLASAPIAPGDHVHVHNVESQRGRGDLHRAASA